MAKTAKLHNFRGQKLTINEICEISGIARNTLVTRVRNLGITYGEAADLGIPEEFKKTLVKKYMYKGELRPLRKISELSGIEIATLNNRMKNMNITADEAVSLGTPEEYRNKKRKRYLLNGEYLTVKEISEKTGVSECSFRRKLFCGKSVEEAAKKCFDRKEVRVSKEMEVYLDRLANIRYSDMYM